MKKTAEELDEMFDNGADMTPYMVKASIRRPNREAKRVNIDFPQWLVNRLDQESM